MRDRRRTLAWWLLLLLTQVLTPEATLLHLHQHQHTWEAGLSRSVPQDELQTVLTPQHRHCHIEQLYDVPFQLPELELVAFGPEPGAYSRYRVQQTKACPLHLADGACLRGPPAPARPAFST